MRKLRKSEKESLLEYLEENVEHLCLRSKLAVARGYDNHLSPSDCDTSLCDEILEKANEWVWDYIEEESDFDDIFEDSVDDLIFDAVELEEY